MNTINVRQRSKFPFFPSFIDQFNPPKELICLKFSPLKIILSFLILNILFILFICWSRTLKRIFLFKECGLENASYFLIKTNDKSIIICKKFWLGIKTGHALPISKEIGFSFRNIIYYLDKQKHCFRILELDLQVSYNQIITKYGAGLNEDLVAEYEKVFPKNKILISVPHIFMLIINEVFSPIYLFQLISLVVWYLSDYLIYTWVVLCLIVITSVVKIKSTHHYFLNLNKMTRISTKLDVIRVRNFKKEKIQMDSFDLLPGDIIVLKKNFKIPADCILIQEKVIVNELNITGEPVAKIKNAISFSERIYENNESSHTILEGSEIIEVEPDKDCLALVTRTGYYSSKGELFRTILYSSEKRLLLLQKQFLQYSFIMSFVSIVGNIVKIALNYESYADVESIAVSFLDLTTIALSPVLPICIYICILISVRNLKLMDIHCFSPYHLLSVGSIEQLFLDKTGTITENKMKLKMIQIVENRMFDNCLMEQENQLLFKNKNETLNMMNLKHIIRLISSCHSLYQIEKNGKLEMNGDLLDMEMFRFSQAEAINDTKKDDPIFKEKILFRAKTHLKTFICNNYDQTNQTQEAEEDFLEVLRVFEFNNFFRRMGVLTYSPSQNKYYYFTKGSTEIIKSLCMAQSVPMDYDKKLIKYAKKGFYILALGYREVKLENASEIQFLDRNLLETNLRFLGFLLYENTLKPNTLESFSILKKAGFNLKIVTGDEGFVSLSLASSLGLITDPNKVIFIDTQQRDNNEIIILTIENFYQIEAKPIISEYSLFNSKDETKEMNLNYEKLFLIKSVCSDSENFSILNETSCMSTRRKHIFSSCKFIKLFFDSTEILSQNEIILTGQAFNYLFVEKLDSFSSSQKEILLKIMNSTKILCKMLPHDKANAVTYLQNNNYIVGMIGDGLNDIGALKKADFGFSICDSEMGMCSSFTTKKESFFCVIELISEGRKTASTIIHLFKYFSLYSFIQFSTVSVLFCYGRGITNSQYLIEDLFIVIFLVFCVIMTKSSRNLSTQIPNLDIFCFDNLISFIGQAVIQFLGQIFIVVLTRGQGWFDPKKEKIDERFGYCSYCPDSNALFLFTLPLLINGILTTGEFSKNREPFYKNYILLLLWIVLNIYGNLIILYEPSRLEELSLEKGMIEQEFLYVICGGGWFTVALLWIWEKVICKRIKSFFSFKFRMEKEKKIEVDDINL